MKLPTHRVRAALTLQQVSIPQIARKHRVSDKTLYAVLDGTRPGKSPAIREAVAEINRRTREARHG